MKRPLIPRQLGLGLAGVSLALLASCAVQPGFSSRVLFFDAPDSMLGLQDRFTGTERLSVYSNTLDLDTANRVQTGTLFIGDKTFKSGQMFLAERSGQYRWNVSSPCKLLPRGDNVLMRYELYAADGTLVKQNSLTIPRLSPC